MSRLTYRLRPKTDRDLEEQELFYAGQVSTELADRFLDAAHETFALLATQPNMGWKLQGRHRDLKPLRTFSVKGFDRILILYLPRLDGVEILRVVHGFRNIAAVLRREGLK